MCGLIDRIGHRINHHCGEAFTLTARSIKVYRTRVSAMAVLSFLASKYDINVMDMNVDNSKI
ncbi:hypothetical protein GCM10007915_23560 [Psychrobacter pacificensis]|uniref:Uncharacterized protein n=1 Tax=Psychrobacter pacificensis TaxID=112002 RepID=A0ABQ5Z1H9_9GAMM|nr:hypothetical protein GCM10007915_23560 [Psychrobacter pacificensis]